MGPPRVIQRTGFQLARRLDPQHSFFLRPIAYSGGMRKDGLGSILNMSN